MIKYNIPAVIGTEKLFIEEILQRRKFSGDGDFNKKCSQWIEQSFNCIKSLITTSCTHSLEMAALLADIQEGDEVIMPSFTFVSTANAFVLRGAKIVFVDIRPDTMNINEKLIEGAITERTKAIVPVHYAGISCEMDTIMGIAKEYGLVVIEDAAQGILSTYRNKYLGTIGQIGCYSFHETKNIHCGEGGALLLNDDKYVERSEIIREKGTDRSKFFRGQVDKYSWVDLGSSYLLSELNAAYLYAQFQYGKEIINDRLAIWNLYYKGLQELSLAEKIDIPFVPEMCKHNGHIFYIKTKDIHERSELINFLYERGIMSVFHYIALHTSEAGKKYGKFHEKDIYTTAESERLLRLPLYYQMEEKDTLFIIDSIYKFYKR